MLRNAPHSQKKPYATQPALSDESSYSYLMRPTAHRPATPAPHVYSLAREYKSTGCRMKPPSLASHLANTSVALLCADRGRSRLLPVMARPTLVVLCRLPGPWLMVPLPLSSRSMLADVDDGERLYTRGQLRGQGKQGNGSFNTARWCARGKPGPVWIAKIC